MKYRDCIPDFLVLADCQDKIKKSIAYGDEQLKLIEDQISIVEKTLDTTKVWNSYLKELDRVTI